MSAARKNTLVIDFSVLPERPKLDMVQRFVEKALGLNPSELKSVQLHNIRHCVLIEMSDLASATRTATRHHLKHGIRINPTKKIAIPVYVDDDTVDVRVHDLPPNMPNDKISEAMSQYGDVLTIRDEVWKNFFIGVPNGVRVLKMKLSKPVPSYVTICDLSTLVTYTQQTATCRRCGLKKHNGKSCSNAAKLTNKKEVLDKKEEKQTEQNQNKPNANAAVLIQPTAANDDGFITVGKKGRPKRQHSQEKKESPLEKRQCQNGTTDDESTSESEIDEEQLLTMNIEQAEKLNVLNYVKWMNATSRQVLRDEELRKSLLSDE